MHLPFPRGLPSKGGTFKSPCGIKVVWPAPTLFLISLWMLEKSNSCSAAKWKKELACTCKYRKGIHLQQATAQVTGIGAGQGGVVPSETCTERRPPTANSYQCMISLCSPLCPSFPASHSAIYLDSSPGFVCYAPSVLSDLRLKQLPQKARNKGDGAVS